MRTTIVVNLHSAGGATGRSWPTLQSKLEGAIGAFDVAITEAPGHATDLAKGALERGAERIIAIGGDGTINEVINGFFDGTILVNPEAILGVIHAGTGGDFCKNLGLPSGPDAQIDTIKRGQTKPISLGLATFNNLDGEATSRYFGVLCAFGISSAVNHYVNHAPWLKRYGASTAFTLAALHMLFTYTNVPVSIQIDNEAPVSGPVLLSATCNGPLVGGGMRMAPDADMFDDRLEFMTGRDIPTLARLGLFARIYQGGHIGRDKVSAVKGHTLSATVLGDAEVPVDMDGDIVGTLPLHITSVPQALRVCV